MTTNTSATSFPLDKIASAFDLLQQHGVISDNNADTELGEWLNDNGLTDDDLNNYEKPRADDTQMEMLADYLLISHTDDARDLALSLAYHCTDGGHPDAVADLIAVFKDTQGE